MDTSDFISKNTHEGINGFDIVKEIGNGGGTSQSYIANTNGKEYFLKRLKKEYLVSPLYRNLYVKEYTIGSEIKHPNIVAYHDVVNNDDDCYILMENIVGETLDCFIKSRPDYFKHRTNLDKFFNQLLSALKCLHENHIVFSDLKPENIMITQVNNDLKLIDLGFCFTDSFSSSAGATKGYASPEHTTGGRLDVSTDIYGVGKIIEYIGKSSAYSLPNIYSKIMLKCLKTNQADRIQTTDEIARLINRRSHNIHKSLIVGIVVALAYITFKSLSYNEKVLSWWDSFELMPVNVEYDIYQTHIYYRIIDEEEKNCMVVSASENPNIYIRPDVTINGETYRVTKIADDAFKNKKFIKSVYIPESITEIGKGAFIGCTNLTSIDIPNSVKHIDNNAFHGCNKAMHLDLPNSITVISMGLAAGSQIEKVIIPEGVKAIELDAFGNCKRLRDVVLPTTLEKIERGVFWNCGSLKEITIPQNVKEIGCYVFFGCDSLTDIYNYAIEPQRVLPIHRNPQKVTLHVPAESVEAYRNADQWGEMRIVGDL